MRSSRAANAILERVREQQQQQEQCLQHAATPRGSSLVLGKEITAVEAVAVRGGEGVEQRLEVAGRV